MKKYQKGMNETISPPSPPKNNNRLTKAAKIVLAITGCLAANDKINKTHNYNWKNIWKEPTKNIAAINIRFPEK